MPSRIVVVYACVAVNAGLKGGGREEARALTHLSEGSLLAGRFPELTPHAQDGDRVIGMVLHADMQQVVRVAVRHTCGALSRGQHPRRDRGKREGGEAHVQRGSSLGT